MNIDSLGPETVDDYYQRGLIHDVSDLYKLTVADICGYNKNRVKSAQKVVDGVKSTLQVPFERVVFAIGIRFVGETTAKLIARHFKSMEALQNATVEQLMEVDGVGQVIAESVVKYFQEPKNAEMVARLAAYGVQMQLSEEQLSGQTDKLAGKSIVISGVFQKHSRDDYKAIIEQNGGKNVGSISKKTTFVLAGDNMGPAKMEKAQSLGVPLVSEDEFLAMLE
jgi:DNA ligase (NAD+)